MPKRANMLSSKDELGIGRFPSGGLRLAHYTRSNQGYIHLGIGRFPSGGLRHPVFGRIDCGPVKLSALAVSPQGD